ncbi:SDR family NAD(P)-dependent oxidoreductase [Rhizomonospora bruguierae]|uniref:SDR family NAD(P)-dependent oxidoreductase n=1 Tax=Rhizomonospora bruguierae TaxID=1581705 RepID=UPI0020BFFD1B|nr:SDR family oxidoreductase [Micromonospora sp. NBRC 107566]
MSRVVVVTGGGTGIGRAIAGRFAADGDEVYVLGRRPGPLEKVAAEHPAVVPVPVDLSVPAEVLLVAKRLCAARIDVLVNNAGGLIDDPGPGAEGAFAGYLMTIEANLLSAMMLTDALWPALGRPGGRVISISSIAAHRGGGDAYAAAKAGLLGWGFGMARKGGADGITVNAVVPGYVQDTEFFNERGRSARHDQLVAETLLGRAGTPDDIAAAVHFRPHRTPPGSLGRCSGSTAAHCSGADPWPPSASSTCSRTAPRRRPGAGSGRTSGRSITAPPPRRGWTSR